MFTANYLIWVFRNTHTHDWSPTLNRNEKINKYISLYIIIYKDSYSISFAEVMYCAIKKNVLIFFSREKKVKIVKFDNSAILSNFLKYI